MIVSVINNKGGVGKTSTCVILAQTALARKLKKIAVIDICGQQNAVDALTKIGKPIFAHIDVISSPGKTPNFSKLQGYDAVIVDTPPNTESAAIRNSIGASNYIVVPFMLQKHSIDGLSEVLAIVPAEKLIPLCILPRGEVTALHELLTTEAERKIGGDFLTWPNYARVEKNIALHEKFCKGLKDCETVYFMNLIDLLNGEKRNGKALTQEKAVG